MSALGIALIISFFDRSRLFKKFLHGFTTMKLRWFKEKENTMII